MMPPRPTPTPAPWTKPTAKFIPAADLPRATVTAGDADDGNVEVKLVPDLTHTQRFLTLLDEGAEQFTFQTFDDTDAKRPRLARLLHGTLDEHVEELTRLNADSAGIFVTVNATDGRGRTRENIVKARALWIDDDAKPGEFKTLPCEPHIIVETSPGKSHKYIFTNTDDLPAWDALQRAMTAYGCDSGVVDRSRVLRLPGFMHCKREPRMVRIVAESGERPLPWDEVQRLFPAPTAPRTEPRHDAEPRPCVTVPDATVRDLRSALLSMRADDRELWVRMGHALHELGDDGRGLWMEWSTTSEKFDAADAARVWDSMHPVRTGYAAVFAEGQRQGWINPASIARAPEDIGDETEQQTIDRLARLDAGEYDRARKDAADQLSMRLGTLDKLVTKARGQEDLDAAGHGLLFDEIELWPHPVDAAALLDDVADTFRRYLALPPHAAEVMALWVAVAHAFDEFQHSPRLNVTAPERGCGKTVCLDVIATLVPRPVPTENVTIAAFFRLAETCAPTFLMDEYDTYLAGDKSGELRGALNAGHRRGGQMIRCVGDDNEPRGFKVFCPVALGGIRELPGTLHDRSIVIRMARATRNEITRLARFDQRRGRERDLARQLARWGDDNQRTLADVDPDMGDIYNRVADNWRPLYAVADVVGGPWPGRVREAAQAHVDVADEDTLAVELLRDIQTIFTARQYRGDDNAERMHTADLVADLNAMEERPWAEYGRSGKGLTGAKLSRLIKPFSVKSTQIRIGPTNRHGYCLEQFADAFARYLDGGN